MNCSTNDDDCFALMPVFYAGGTTSFTPKSEDVIAEYQKIGRKGYRYFDNRGDAYTYLKTNICSSDTAIVMGARDNSLSDWTCEICD